MTLTVDGVTLPVEAIEREAQRYAEAPDPEAAARRSLAVRALLLQRARELGLAEEHPGPDAEDAIIGRVQERALRQYLRVLAAQAEIDGADLEAAASPLVK